MSRRIFSTSTKPCCGSPRMEAEEGPVLQGQVGNIVKALYRQMKEKSIKTRADLRPLDISQTTFSLYTNNIYQC